MVRVQLPIVVDDLDPQAVGIPHEEVVDSRAAPSDWGHPIWPAATCVLVYGCQIGDLQTEVLHPDGLKVVAWR